MFFSSLYLVFYQILGFCPSSGISIDVWDLIRSQRNEKCLGWGENFVQIFRPVFTSSYFCTLSIQQVDVAVFVRFQISPSFKNRNRQTQEKRFKIWSIKQTLFLLSLNEIQRFFQEALWSLWSKNFSAASQTFVMKLQEHVISNFIFRSTWFGILVLFFMYDCSFVTRRCKPIHMLFSVWTAYAWNMSF